jgi:small neutral amino acid transporter SnatA (MarC family)
MEQSNVLNWALVLFGILILGASIFNWSYFFNLRKAQFLVRSFGLTTTRVIYAILGIIFTLVGANHLFNLGLLSF